MFPRWERFIPILGTVYSHARNNSMNSRFAHLIEHWLHRNYSVSAKKPLFVLFCARLFELWLRRNYSVSAKKTLFVLFCARLFVILQCRRFAQAMKREWGVSPQLSRSCKFPSWAIHISHWDFREGVLLGNKSEDLPFVSPYTIKVLVTNSFPHLWG